MLLILIKSSVFNMLMYFFYIDFTQFLGFFCKSKWIFLHTSKCILLSSLYSTPPTSSSLNLQKVFRKCCLIFIELDLGNSFCSVDGTQNWQIGSWHLSSCMSHYQMQAPTIVPSEFSKIIAVCLCRVMV